MTSVHRTREVLLFGLSANPPTGTTGHMGVVKHCRAFYDEIWLVPVFQHVYSTKRELAPFEHRVEMCRLALETLKREQEDGAELKVVEEEREMFEHVAATRKYIGRIDELRLGSVDLVLYLLGKYQDTNFTMLLGGDTYADLLAGKWNRGDELMQLVKFLVVDRKGVESPWRTEEQPRQSANVRCIHIPELSSVSSTRVRATADRDELAAYLDPAVLEYIVQHQLYAFAALRKECTS
uniref:Cytidyltransferase-like domain-containing protein n=1 Tax=Peronospora matthiolae TaxID=2874970 RepID=A0AAV1TMP9_9STRA